MTGLRDGPTGTSLRRVVSGVLLGGVILVAYVGVVGVGGVRRAVWAVPPAQLLSLVAVGLVPLCVWGFGLRVVFGRLGRPLSVGVSILLFAASGFLNSVTPFGQVGGDPPSAALFSRTLGVDFETALAAISSLNALNRVAAVFLGLLSVGYLGSHVGDVGTFERTATFVVGLAIAIGVGGALAWAVRERLVSLFVTVATPLTGRVGRIVPGAAPPTRGGLERRAYRFVEAIERLAADPLRLSAVFGLGILGHLSVATALWVALAALGVHASFAVVLLVLPLAKLSGIAPTPGGFGGAEALLGMLLLSATSAESATAGAAVLLYRTSAFWVPTVIGGVALGWLVVNAGTETDEDTEPSAGTRGHRHRPAAGDTPTDETAYTVPTLLLALSAALAALLVVAVHRQQVVVEPDNVVVHAVRDVGLVVLVFVATSGLVRRLARAYDWLHVTR